MKYIGLASQGPWTTRERSTARMYSKGWEDEVGGGGLERSWPTHEYPLVPMGTHGYPWVSIGTHEYPWVPMCIHADPLVPMETQGYLWVPIVPHRSQWVPMGLMGSHGHPCLAMGTNGSPWVGTHGHPWVSANLVHGLLLHRRATFGGNCGFWPLACFSRGVASSA